MTDRASVDGWLQRYVAAWKSYDREAIAALWSDDATQRFHPFDDPIAGRDAIVESWFDEPDEPGTYDASYETVAVDGDVAVATGASTYLNDDGSVRTTYDNCFVMRFDPEGRCREFTEWFIERPEGTGG